MRASAYFLATPAAVLTKTAATKTAASAAVLRRLRRVRKQITFVATALRPLRHCRMSPQEHVARKRQRGAVYVCCASCDGGMTGAVQRQFKKTSKFIDPLVGFCKHTTIRVRDRGPRVLRSILILFCKFDPMHPDISPSTGSFSYRRQAPHSDLMFVYRILPGSQGRARINGSLALPRAHRGGAPRARAPPAPAARARQRSTS